MNVDRIQEIQSQTAYPDSTSVAQALLQVWREVQADNAMLKVQKGTPTKQGMYVAYVEGPSTVFPEKKLLMWISGVWGYPSSDQNYRGEVFGFIGPLPAPPITELVDDVPYYAIGLKTGDTWAFVDGPNPVLKTMLDTVGEHRHYILELPHTGEPKPLYRWNHVKSEWRVL